MNKYLGNIVVGLALFAGTAGADPRTAQQDAFGAEQHHNILERFGGGIPDERTAEFVRDVGLKLAALTEQANDQWTFTVLDTPVVNAFAVPGGYIYVTRGLLALANDEAELAGVLAHEIAHILEDHLSDRDDAGGDAIREGLLAAVIGGLLSDGEDRLGDAIKGGVMATVGYLGKFSQGQEFEADKLGVELLARAGYDPRAQADFLESLSAKHALESQLAGREYTPNSVEFFATHPADSERVERALREADLFNTDQTRPRNQRGYFDIIDGMIYGDSPDQGFVRKHAFFHPTMRFAYQVPYNFTITNSAESVRARGPLGSTMILTGGGAPNGSLTRYIELGWARDISRQERTGDLRDIELLEINGLEAATAILPLHTRRGEMDLRLTVIRRGDFLFRISGTSPAGERAIAAEIFDAMKTFKSLEGWEVELLHPYTISIEQVGWRNTVERYANNMPFDNFREERFRTLNGLDEGDELQRGDYVKMIVE